MKKMCPLGYLNMTYFLREAIGAHSMSARSNTALACLHSSLVFSFLFPCSFLLFSTFGVIVYLCFLGDVQSDLFCYLFGQNPINIYIYEQQ